MAGAVSPTNLVASATPVVAPANPAVLAEFAEVASCIIGEIIMLAGIAPSWATDAIDCTGNADAADCTPDTNPGTAVATPCTAGLIAAEAEVASPLNWAPTLAANPARSTGGTENGVRLAATPVAPP